LRKYLVAALAAAIALAATSVALAQKTSHATLTVKVTPTKSGTKKKPVNGKTVLNIVNDDTSRTMDNLKIWLPSNAKLNLKGFKACSQAQIDGQTCPKSAALGTGIAEAMQGVNAPVQNSLYFKVTPFPMSKNKIGFFLQQLNKDANNQPTSTPTPGGITVTSVGTLKSAKKPYGQLLDIAVPTIAQQFPPGSYNGLVSLKTTLSKKKGNHFLVSNVGCVHKKYNFKALMHFIANPDPANAGTASATASAKCK
jgi:hypothetical protein